jgi:hypothetical protein
LNEANGAWQQYQFTQLDHFRNKLQDYIDLDEHFSFDQAAQLIIDRIIKERKELEKTNEDLRAGKMFINPSIRYQLFLPCRSSN